MISIANLQLGYPHHFLQSCNHNLGSFVSNLVSSKVYLGNFLIKLHYKVCNCLHSFVCYFIPSKI